MKAIYLAIEKINKGIVLSVIVLFCIIESFSIFPLKLELSISTIFVIYCYVMVGVICHAAFKKNFIFIAILTFLANTMGLTLRIWVESKNLQASQLINISNLLIAYMPVLLILLGYQMTKNFIENYNNINKQI